MTFLRTAGLLAVVAGLTVAAHGSLSARPLQPPDEASAENAEAICKLVAQEQNLSGAALADSIQSCIVEERPDLAYWESCRTTGRKRHLRGTILRSYVTECLHEAQ